MLKEEQLRIQKLASESEREAERIRKQREEVEEYERLRQIKIAKDEAERRKWEQYEEYELEKLRLLRLTEHHHDEYLRLAEYEDAERLRKIKAVQ